MARPVTLFTGQWADLPIDELAVQVRRLGLRRPGAGLLGRPLRRRRGDARLRLRGRAPARLLESHGLGCWAIGNHLVGPGGLRPDRRAPQGRAVPGDLGRRRSRGGAAARRRGDEGHGPRGGPARRRRRHRLHRLADLAHGLLVPAQRLRRDRARLPGVRRALGADHRRVRGRGRAVRARGPPDRDRLRLRHDAQGAGRDRRPPGLRHQLRPEPLRAPVPGLGGVHHRVRQTRSSTRTSRTRSSTSTAAPRSSAGTCNFGEPGRGLGLRLPGPRRRRLRGHDPRAQPDRVQRSPLDRVGGFRDGPRLGSAGRARRSCVRRTSPPPRSRSTPRSRRSPECPRSDSSRWARPPEVRTSSPSAWACSDTRSWARRTRTRTRRSRT